METESFEIMKVFFEPMSRKLKRFFTTVSDKSRWWQNNFREDNEDIDHETVRARVLCPSAPAPSTVNVKDFFRFYVKQSKGLINKHASVESVVTNAEWFYAGFTRVTGTPTLDKDRTEVFWVRYIRVVMFCALTRITVDQESTSSGG